MRIFIDTNIYLDFYRSTDEALQIFDELFKNEKTLIITDQLADEYFRNREIELKNLKVRFTGDSALENFANPFLGSFEELKELNALRKEYYKIKKSIEQRIDKTISEESADPIATNFKRLLDGGKVILLETTNNIMTLAQNRKLKGNPPISKGKYTIGDEINWELLLEKADDDLIIVSRDGTFTGNFNFLANEFKKKNGKIVTITKRITDALKGIGDTPSPGLVSIEKKQIEEIQENVPRWKITKTYGNIIDVTDGRNYGYTVKDTNNADPSWFCGNCGSYGPWSGARCLNCGMLSED